MPDLPGIGSGVVQLESTTAWAPEQFQFDEAVSIHQGLTAKSCRLRLKQRYCVMEAHEGAWRWRDQGVISSGWKQPQVYNVHGLAAGADLCREIFAGWRWVVDGVRVMEGQSFSSRLFLTHVG